jgi:putative Mg2+ transporter-C (MgtC) family protein
MAAMNMDGQGTKQFLELGAAFLLSALIGLEREIRHKSAGLRTYTVVGTTAALFLLISKYGFTDVLSDGRVVLDPSGSQHRSSPGSASSGLALSSFEELL